MKSLEQKPITRIEVVRIRTQQSAPCFERPGSDEGTSPSEQRAWSSPIFLDFAS